MIGEDQEIADDYLAIIEINHKNSQMSASITCPVLALDHFPESTLDIINSPSVWKIPYDTMRNLLKMEEIVCGDEEMASFLLVASDNQRKEKLN